jgi:hypothetical protein
MARTGDPTDFVSYVDRLVEGYRSRYEPHVEAKPTFAVAEPLSVREGDILNLIARGRSNKEIARSLSIAPETVKTHVSTSSLSSMSRNERRPFRARKVSGSSPLHNSCCLRPCPVTGYTRSLESQASSCLHHAAVFVFAALNASKCSSGADSQLATSPTASKNVVASSVFRWDATTRYVQAVS